MRPVRRVLGTIAAVLACVGAWCGAALGQAPSLSADAPGVSPVPPAPAAAPDSANAPATSDDEYLKQFLETNVTPIDLLSALRLAGEQNSDILVAQQRVTEAVALRQLAAAQFLPTLNAGTSENTHRGVLQQSDGTIIRVNRDSLYVGAGAMAIGAGTVTIPGVLWTMNLSQTIYDYLISRRTVDVQGFRSQAVSQDTLLQVALAYVELVRAEGQRAVAVLVRNDAAEIARLTAIYAKTGAGRQADADRAATELGRREATLVQIEGQIGVASARLCQLLHLDPSLRLHALDEHVLPQSIVPEPIPLADLLAIAALNRPEVKEQRSLVIRALLALDQARRLPFSPTVYIGYSAGLFGGGSSIVDQPPLNQPRYGDFSSRQDFDVMAYWTLLNLGVGNKALIDAAHSRLRSADLQQVFVLDQIRAEVAAAYAKTHARYAQIRTCELAIRSGTDGFKEDMTRILGHQGLPLEAINSLRLLARSRVDYLNAILDYNRAQFRLYVAVGRPPADLLVRPAGENGEDPAAGRQLPPGWMPAVPPAPK